MCNTAGLRLQDTLGRALRKFAFARLIYKSDFYQIFTKGSSVHVGLHKVGKLIKYNKTYEIFRKN